VLQFTLLGLHASSVSGVIYCCKYIYLGTAFLKSLCTFNGCGEVKRRSAFFRALIVSLINDLENPPTTWWLWWFESGVHNWQSWLLFFWFSSVSWNWTLKTY